MAARNTLGDRCIVPRLPRTVIYVIIACIISGACFGVIVLTDKGVCPVCEKEIAVLKIMSCGSYIYDQNTSPISAKKKKQG
jgi:hypothetical protein